jgi:hypothetical protein
MWCTAGAMEKVKSRLCQHTAEEGGFSFFLVRKRRVLSGKMERDKKLREEVKKVKVKLKI